MIPNLRLYLVTDRGLAKGRSTRHLVEQAIAGGVTTVQLREKDLSTRACIEEAQALREVVRARGVALIIKDQVDVALAVGADGVHLGQQDMQLGLARRLVGTDMCIGISVESVDDAQEAASGGADYLGVSPVYATPTKTETAPASGLAGLQAIRQAVNLPLVAMGGIHAGTAADVPAHGADGLAVVSAIVSAEDPAAAARGLRDIVERHEGHR